MKAILITLAILMSQNVFAVRTIVASGRGSQNSFCNANSGPLCIDGIKNMSERAGQRQATWTCEMNYRGRPLTYTSSCYTSCSPNYLPPNHNGTWVYCNTDCNVQCEIDN